MKRLLGGVLILVFTFSPLFAKSTVTAEKIELAKKGLLFSLKSENDGVRNSALHVLAKVRSEHPQADLSVFNKALTQMSKNDDRSFLRANANLAYIYINSTELPSKVRTETQEDPSVFFNELYSELNKDFVALNK